jgi:nucleoside-diphosphate-sugar epimerase
MDESFGPLAPRNVYGVTKLEAERLCGEAHEREGMAVLVLRTSRFFPEDDDTHREPSGENLKANELLHRRLTVEDAADAHVIALEKAPALGFDTFILSAPPPFVEADAEELVRDAPAVIARYFPEAPRLYAERGWTLPPYIDRVYDPSRAERRLGFRCRTDFRTVLEALAAGRDLPFAHDPSYVSPKEPRI